RHIYLDSECVSRTRNQYLSEPLAWTNDKIIKLNNFPIWKFIFDLIANNHLTLMLHKVIAYSDDIYNDRADTLAKAGASLDLTSNLDLTNFNRFTFTFPLFYNCFIDGHFKDFILDLQKANQFNKYLLLTRNSTIRHYTALDFIDWSLTSLYLNSKGKSHFTTFKESTFNTFKIKLMFDLLPVLETLKLRKPNLYDPSLTCLICSRPLAFENINHLWSCWYYKPITMRALTACKDLVKRKILKHNPDATFSDLENLDCWTLALSAFDIDAFHLIHRFIPSSLTRSVQVLTRNQQKT